MRVLAFRLHLRTFSVALTNVDLFDEPVRCDGSSALPNVTGVVLAGGFGTRLRSVLRDSPKVLAQVNNRPFLLILLDQLVDAGVSRIVLCTGYLGDQVRSAVGGHHRESRGLSPTRTGCSYRRSGAARRSDYPD